MDPNRILIEGSLVVILRDLPLQNVRLPEDGCGAVQEVRGEVEHDGELGELLEELPRGEGRIVRGPAADQEKPAAPLRDRKGIMSILFGHISKIESQNIMSSPFVDSFFQKRFLRLYYLCVNILRAILQVNVDLRMILEKFREHVGLGRSYFSIVAFPTLYL